MLPLALALALCVFVHVSVMALAARLAGVAVREVSYGCGPRLLSIGRVRIRLLLLGGALKMKDTRNENVPPTESGDAFDTQSLPVQLAIALSGCAGLLGLALLAGASENIDAFIAGFQQFFAGALSPTNEAPRLLSTGVAFAQSQPFVSVCALVAAKMAALNLLPFPALNGGQAVGMLLRGVGFGPRWADRFVTPLLVVLLLLAASWLLAMGSLLVDRG